MWTQLTTHKISKEKLPKTTWRKILQRNQTLTHFFWVTDTEIINQYTVSQIEKRQIVALLDISFRKLEVLTLGLMFVLCFLGNPFQEAGGTRDGGGDEKSCQTVHQWLERAGPRSL